MKVKSSRDEQLGNHFNQLTPQEDERLALLLEEMGESIQIIGKILRHGYESTHPLNNQFTNRQLLQLELSDVCAAMGLMIANNDIAEKEIDEYTHVKLSKINQYLHHNRAIG